MKIFDPDGPDRAYSEVCKCIGLHLYLHGKISVHEEGHRIPAVEMMPLEQEPHASHETKMLQTKQN
jgi:hypothetical protein